MSEELGGEIMIEKDNRRMSSRDWMQSLYIPIFLLILTAFLGGGIGACLQNRSFKRNEIFKARLEAIENGRKEAANLLQDTLFTLRRIRGMQENMSNSASCQITDMKPYTDTLRLYETRTTLIRDYTETIPKNPVNKSIKDFSENLVNVIDCVEKTPCQRCDAFSNKAADSLRTVIGEHTKMTNQLLNESESNWY